MKFCIAYGAANASGDAHAGITVMASAIAMAFNYAHQPSYAAHNHAQQELDADGNPVRGR